ncbi:MAG: hypothetical protein E7561_04120 [Ruminococcaceae bacterium]|nr:hypothetical protein [Oscillospiraceae bacterium]
MIMKYFKKIFSVLFIAVIIAAAQPYIAAEEPLPEIRTLSTVCEADGTVSVRLWLSKNTGLVSLRFNVEYSDKLTLLSVTDGGILGEYYHSDNLQSPYTLYWANDTENENFTDNGVLALLNFALADNVSVGDVLTVTPIFESGNDNALDKDSDALVLNAFSGTVTVQNSIDGINTPFLYITDNNNIYVSGITENVSDITIASTYTANSAVYTVTEISDYAFAGCSEIESIVLPESITNIGEGAFLGCKSLSVLDIPDNVQYIGDDAFYGCDTLKLYCYPYSTSYVTLNNSGVDYQLYGDLYTDNEINALDLIEMKKKLLINTKVDENAADINRDGKINILDFIFIKKLCIETI